MILDDNVPKSAFTNAMEVLEKNSLEEKAEDAKEEIDLIELIPDKKDIIKKYKEWKAKDRLDHYKEEDSDDYDLIDQREKVKDVFEKRQEEIKRLSEKKRKERVRLEQENEEPLEKVRGSKQRRPNMKRVKELLEIKKNAFSNKGVTDKGFI